VGKPEGRKPLGKSRNLWEDTKMDIQEVGWNGDWINLTLNKYTCRLSCVHGKEVPTSTKCVNFLTG
jgi:hypothetical protein